MQKEKYFSSEEDFKISKASFYLLLQLPAPKGSDHQKLTDRDGTDSITDVDTETQTVTIEQKIFQGLGGKADLEKVKLKI